MTIPDTMARLGYGTAQAAAAAGCSVDTIERALAGRPVSRSVELALEYHARLVDLGGAEPVPAPRMGRPRAA